MKMSLNEFYERIRRFLIESSLEQEATLFGHSDTEIVQAERKWSIKFPEAYRLFLKYFAVSIKMFEDQAWDIEELEIAHEVSQEIAERNKFDLSNWFVFTQRQGYSFYAFELIEGNNTNPKILLGVEGDNGLELYKYSSFTDLLILRIHGYLKSMANPKQPKTEQQLTQFEELKALIY